LAVEATTAHAADGTKRPLGEVPVFGGERTTGSYAETDLVELVEVPLADNQGPWDPMTVTSPSELSVLFALPRPGVTLPESSSSSPLSAVLRTSIAVHLP
jgi:hypothetical protein